MLPEEATIAGILSAAGIDHAECSVGRLGLVCRLPCWSLVSAMPAFAEAGFSMLVDLVGTDTGEDIELTYHVRSFVKDEELFVKAQVPYGGEAPSGWGAYPALLFPEREVAELLGMTFTGHPNPKRLLTTEDSPQYLLRKTTRARTHGEARDARKR